MPRRLSKKRLMIRNLSIFMADGASEGFGTKGPDAKTGAIST